MMEQIYEIFNWTQNIMYLCSSMIYSVIPGVSSRTKQATYFSFRYHPPKTRILSAFLGDNTCTECWPRPDQHQPRVGSPGHVAGTPWPRGGRTPGPHVAAFPPRTQNRPRVGISSADLALKRGTGAWWTSGLLVPDAECWALTRSPLIGDNQGGCNSRRNNHNAAARREGGRYGSRATDVSALTRYLQTGTVFDFRWRLSRWRRKLRSGVT